jgi:hypothetical protein
MGQWQNCLIYLNQWKSLTLCLKIHRLRRNRYGNAHLFEEALLSKMDPNVVSSYRRALSSRSRQLNCTKSTNGIRSLGSSSPMTTSYSFSNSWYCLSGCEDKIVIYFTSLRGIRKTYEDCCSVRMIFRGFRVSLIFLLLLFLIWVGIFFFIIKIWIDMSRQTFLILKKTVSHISNFHPTLNDNDHFDTSLKGWRPIWHSWKVRTNLTQMPKVED